MKKYFSCLGLVFGTLLVASSLLAQPCLSLKPAPECRSNFITEFGYSHIITSPLKGGRTNRHYITSELGYIHNLNAEYGLGFTHFTGLGSDYGLHGGLKLRVRKWLTPKTSLDFSGGAILWNSNDFDFKKSIFIGGTSLNFSQSQAVNVLIEISEPRLLGYPYTAFNSLPSHSRRNVSVYLGYKVSGKLGLALHGVTIASLGVAYTVFYALFHAYNE